MFLWGLFDQVHKATSSWMEPHKSQTDVHDTSHPGICEPSNDSSFMVSRGPAEYSQTTSSFYSPPKGSNKPNKKPQHREDSLVFLGKRTVSASIRENVRLTLLGRHPINYRYSLRTPRYNSSDYSIRLNRSPFKAPQPSQLERYAELKRRKQKLLERSRKYFELHPQPPQTKKSDIPTLNPQAEQVLESYLKMPIKQLLGEVFKVDLYIEDLHRLCYNKWLNDSIIDAFLSYVTADDPRFFAFTTHFYTKLQQEGYKGVRRWAIRKKLNILEKDKIFIPVNKGNMHWCLAVIDNKNKRLSYFDSLAGPGNEVIENLVTYISGEMDRLQPDKKQQNLSLLQSYSRDPQAECPQQENGSDCGVFTCQNAVEALKGETFNYSQKDIPNVRGNIAYTLVSLAKGLDSKVWPRL